MKFVWKYVNVLKSEKYLSNNAAEIRHTLFTDFSMTYLL